MTRHLTFYGHFTGSSSYPVVCREIARWLIDCGYSVSLANLRERPIDDFKLAARQVLFDYNGDNRAENKRSAPGAGLLFGFPAWHTASSIPRHELMIGYHVPDVRPPPADWFGLIERGCDVVLTPSCWGHELITDLGVTKPVYRVRHGIDPEIFAPDESCAQGEVRVLRHFCSSPQLDRKGTLQVLACAERLIQEVENVHVIISVPATVRYMLEPDKERKFASGSSLEIIYDEPVLRELMAGQLRHHHALVAPSRAEGFGCIPLESIACGTPVVTTDVTGHAEWFNDVKDACYRVKTGHETPCAQGRAPLLDVESLYGAMSCAVGEEARDRETVLGVSELVRAQWAWDRVLDTDLAPVLRSLL